jgi:hypothetical protein
MKSKDIFNILSRKHDHKCVKFFIKEMKSENLELSISHGTICGGYGKKLNEVQTFCHVQCLQIQTFLKKFQRVEMCD